MRTLAKRFLMLVLAGAMALGLGGCLLNSEIDPHETPQQIELDAQANLKKCTIDSTSPEQLKYVFGYTGNEITGSIALGAIVGLTADLMCDPVILEVPADASNFQGSLTAFFVGNQPLVITAGLTEIPIDENTTLVAEAGTQMVIVELPAGTMPGAYPIKLSYSNPGSVFKVLFTAKVQVGATTYYPPLLPCVTDFASVPALSTSASITFPQAAALLTANPPCQGKAYSLGGNGVANYQGLWWAANGNESGWGINFAHQDDQIFATWYTYDTNGKAWWVSMLASRGADNSYSGPIYADNGPPFDHFSGAAAATQVGTGTLTFNDANNGSFKYTITTTMPATTQTKAINRFDLGTGPQPTCTYSAATPNFVAATNYQDLWWASYGAEPGWGINFAHQGDTIFATWYTYGEDNTPLWLTALAPRVGQSNAYTGTLYRTSGARFDAFDAASVVRVPVGTATFTFADGNNAMFEYDTNGADAVPVASQRKPITRFQFAPAGGTICG